MYTFQIFLNSPAFYDLFAYTELPTFDLASDAFATLRNDVQNPLVIYIIADISLYALHTYNLISESYIMCEIAIQKTKLYSAKNSNQSILPFFSVNAL